MELIKGNVKITFVELGEGYNGEYNPNDPNDAELERFDIYLFEEGEWWMVVGDSYCTALEVCASDEIKQRALTYLMDTLYEPVLRGDYKRLAEELSWISKEWFMGGR